MSTPIILCTVFVLGTITGLLVGAYYFTNMYNGRPLFVGPDGQGLQNGTYEFSVENRERRLISLQKVEKHGPVGFRRIVMFGNVNGVKHPLPEVFEEDSGIFSFKQHPNNSEWKKINPFA